MLRYVMDNVKGFCTEKHLDRQRHHAQFLSNLVKVRWAMELPAASPLLSTKSGDNPFTTERIESLLLAYLRRFPAGQDRIGRCPEPA
jgi:hypothetical protein